MRCRICHNNKLIDIIDLREQVITSRFPKFGDFSTPKTPIVLSLCQSCSLVQLRYCTPPAELYEHISGYGYRSGINNTMRDHLRAYNVEIQSKLSPVLCLSAGDAVLDIGSNDSTMLQYYDPSLKRIGVDPTGKQFQQYYGDVDLIPAYFTREVVEKTYGIGFECRVISSISMFYDLPDPVQFARDIYNLLTDDGIWTCEQSYLLSMLETNSIDTICHEHLEYYSLTAIKHIADTVGFVITDVRFNQCNGGSFRLYFAKEGQHKESPLVAEILAKEERLGVKTIEFYQNFVANCDAEIDQLKAFLKDNVGHVYIYGASTKGNCLLQYAGIDATLIPYAVERNLNKVGKMTSTGIEIISEETMRCNVPKFLLVLPWHFREEIIAREHEFLTNGGKLVFPFPHFEIYSQ
jgi:hypothetical protein